MSTTWVRTEMKWSRCGNLMPHAEKAKALFFFSVSLGCSTLMHDVRAELFDTSLLAGRSKESDLSRFLSNVELPAGQHTLDVYVNELWKGRFDVLLGHTREDVKIASTAISQLGLDTSRASYVADSRDWVPVNQISEGATFVLDISTQSLRLSVPQAHMRRAEESYIDPEFWDTGLPALIIGYNAVYNRLQTQSTKVATNDFYSGLNLGVNIGGWQFREFGSVRKRSTEQVQYQSNLRYVQKNIAPLKSVVRIGEFYSGGDLFDSVKTKGIGLSSDINMLPNSMQAFSPIVRGTARTNAVVIVKQNGSIIYQENVPPGPFVIDTLPHTGSAGDLTAIVQEATGEVTSFTIPFSSVPSMLKAGVSKYALTLGSAVQPDTNYAPDFFQATWQRGLDNLATGYLGSTVSTEYQAYLIGGAFNLPVGALSLDVTHARTKLKQQDFTGQSVRITYSKLLDATATNFTLGAFRYSSADFYTFDDAIYATENNLSKARKKHQERFDIHQSEDIAVMDMKTWDSLTGARPRNNLSLNVSQRLPGEWGSVYFSGVQRDYWGSDKKSREYQLGFSKSFNQVSVNVSVNKVRDSHGRDQTRSSIGLTIPFEIFSSRATMASSVSFTDSRYSQSNTSVSGSALQSQRLSYSAAASHDPENRAVSLGTSYRANNATVGATIGEASDYRQFGLDARGTVVMIPGKILATNEMGNTMIVVEAPKAKGLVVNGDASVVTDEDGFALLAYASPYRSNSIMLSEGEDTSGGRVIGNVAHSVPFADAVAKVTFKTDLRQALNFRAVRDNGAPLPFGAEVLDHAGNSVGYVGQASTVFINYEERPSQLTVRMHDSACAMNLPDALAPRASVSCR
ncbi:fimbria/pilus outer membrane usher protein [Pseudomonas putida]|uniref:fimbria/pilus outer membrane usher protein n=1 Tax=Pseudomonas putida TaxID=303 RepID=UPI003B22200A